MGWHSAGGGPKRAPDVFFNHCGSPPWAGKKLADISEAEQDDLLEFAASFAFAEGRTAGCRKEEMPDWNLFHPKFMGGAPHTLFAGNLAAGYAAGQQDRIDEKLDELEAQQAIEETQRRRKEMDEFAEDVRRALWNDEWGYGRCARPVRKTFLGSSVVERVLFTVIARRLLRPVPEESRAWRWLLNQWFCLRFRLTRFIPTQWMYFPGRLATTLARKHETQYTVFADFYASNVASKRPRFREIHCKLTRLEALALTWYYHRLGAYKVTCEGFIAVREYPSSGMQNPLAVPRLGWSYDTNQFNEPYLGIPRFRY